MIAQSKSQCVKCNNEFNIFERGSVGAVIVKGSKSGSSMPDVKHFNFCKKCAKILGLDKYSKK